MATIRTPKPHRTKRHAKRSKRDDGSEVNISAQASAAPVTVQGQVLTPTEVMEVEVIPEASSAGTTVTISGDRKGLARTVQVGLEIWLS